LFDVKTSGSAGFCSFFTIICVLLLMTLVLGGFAVYTSLSNAATQYSVIQLPDFVTDPEAVRGAEMAYQAAAKMPELFGRIPCFCGCSLTGKHHSNLDCFVESWSADKVVFTSHGST